MVRSSYFPPRDAGVRHVLITVVVLGVMFQLGHFVEHAAQFGVWLFGSRTSAWMSGLAMWLVHHLGEMAAPQASHMRQMAIGMELLHFIGNTIFLVTIACFYALAPSRNAKYALYVEGFHLVEHILLTGSVVFLDKAIGMSTLFGYSSMIFSQEGVVGYRVFWHFAMNLVPSYLLMTCLMQARASASTRLAVA